jgi:FKBP-type peptidyl-prolyl cis-trans isomerase
MIVALAAILSTAMAGAIAAGEELDFEEEATRINYSLGYQIGGDFKRQNVDMNATAVIQGIEDALANAEPKMSPEEMQATLVELKRKVTEAQRASRRKNELQLIEDGKAFMAENAKKDGVITTETGLQYRIVEPGMGKAPAATDMVTVNYSGTHPNGAEFDSGEEIQFRLNGVIAGWTEGLQKIREGGRIELVIPPDLAYGGRGPLAHRTLLFDIELLTVENPEAN